MPLGRRFLFLTAFLFSASGLFAAAISGTVKDSTGAVIPRARIEIRGGALEQPVVTESDGAGHFTSPDLKPGSYTVRVTAPGFEAQERNVEISANTQNTDFQLAIAAVKEQVTVAAKSARFANTDSTYQQLRRVGLGTAFQVEGFTVKCDAATFQLNQGTIVFLAPVHGAVTGAVYIGSGHLHLTPAHRIARGELMRRVKSEELDEDFTEIVFRYSGPFGHALLGASLRETATPSQAASVLEHWRETVRKRREEPLGLTESLLHGEAMDNVDAEILASLYNPDRPGFFDAYIHGVKHKDLRFFYRPRGGAIPYLCSPDEVALVNYDPEGMDDGIWYLDHSLQEYKDHTASSEEDRRYVAARKFKVETVIGKNDHLTSVATITFSALLSGERVVKFRLLPNLRVTRVSDAAGQDMYYIQENRKEDGSFYAVLPEGMEAGKDYSITVEYSGDKVLIKAGNGSYYVRARESWYPDLNGFNERALYDLTYKVPKKYKVISVGTLDREWMEGDYVASHWITPTPVAVAGFNFGEYRKLELPDSQTGTRIEGYFLNDLPDSLSQYRQSALEGMSPKAMTQYALEQTRAQLQLCSFYFGKTPFDHIYITEQPDFNFGQSWPNLVYLPISAYIDSTQRWMLFGNIDTKFQGFVDEVTPHEVAHQWWGHAVGWSSYHDQWLSEGFAEFSAGLFLQQARGKDWVKDYVQFWDRLQKRVFEKNQFGVAPNDAGPIWLGLRLTSARSERAYFDVTYAKGAYILSMLRSMMYDPKDHDKPFIDMMHDFVSSHQDHPASTESFKAIAEKHMTPAMDLQKNGRLDWFFNEWVYGTQAPRYKFSYETSPGEGNKIKLHISITQSDVDNNFAMLVPVYGDFGKGMIMLMRVPMIGDNTRTFDTELPFQPKKMAVNAYKEILER
ncbi:MAG TPA: carboxypeptidase regulatory-like domain-containing protein [Terriglobales bacterium]|nr:carboxypeptidase regulatory-like domain-containing protein [Terriglobales bacterium]